MSISVQGGVNASASESSLQREESQLKASGSFGPLGTDLPPKTQGTACLWWHMLAVVYSVLPAAESEKYSCSAWHFQTAHALDCCRETLVQRKKSDSPSSERPGMALGFTPCARLALCLRAFSYHIFTHVQAIPPCGAPAKLVHPCDTELLQP